MSLRVKPFGKDGLRLLYQGGGDGCVLEVRWPKPAAASTSEGGEGFKSGRRMRRPQTQRAPSSSSRIPTHAPPYGAYETATTPQTRSDSPCPPPPRRSAAFLSPTLPLDDAELAFNVLQWFGTVVVDCRPEASSRLRESHLLTDAAAIGALPPKDDAVAIGASPELLEALSGRVRRAVHALSDAALRELCERYPSLVCADAGDDASKSRRPVLPNLVDGALLVGHQGHALCLADWEKHVPLGAVLNLAAEHVDPAPARKASEAAVAERGIDGWPVIEVRCPSDGQPLTDKVGDGERLIEALPSALEAIATCVASGRLAFVHCQQGRSRAGSFATAHLLSTHPEWTLLDAVRFLAARRPETEIAEDYIVALEGWATETLGRKPSLKELRMDCPRRDTAAATQPRSRRRHRSGIRDRRCRAAATSAGGRAGRGGRGQGERRQQGRAARQPAAPRIVWRGGDTPRLRLARRRTACRCAGTVRVRTEVRGSYDSVYSHFFREHVLCACVLQQLYNQIIGTLTHTPPHRFAAQHTHKTGRRDLKRRRPPRRRGHRYSLHLGGRLLHHLSHRIDKQRRAALDEPRVIVVVVAVAPEDPHHRDAASRRLGRRGSGWCAGRRCRRLGLRKRTNQLANPGSSARGGAYCIGSGGPNRRSMSR